MKKKLEADLMSIAHRVLQMKNKSDINQLCIETRKLYEKLAILQFVEEHFEGAKPTIGQAEIVEKMKQFFEENHLSDIKPTKVPEEVVANKVVVEETVEEVSIIEEAVVDENEEILEEEVVEIESEEGIVAESSDDELKEVDFMPAFGLDEVEEEEIEEEIQAKPEEVQISFMDLLGGDYTETMFVKVDHNAEKSNPLDFDLPKETNIQSEREKLLAEMELNPKDIEPKPVSLNEKLAHGISIDLNDRIGFVKNLFSNSDEDYNRVLNQLITYDNFEEARSFIEDMVKPDYGDWEGKEDYEQRFIEIIEKKFA
ncbi:hypothetical protein SAMN05443549_101303 [Flavobacterium fluvii]|uniref:Uncharacterized protein n=1 Tax=Flavobacterium fluvii TaxID=468056 RepID=A0A1M5EEJ4_9FLAO|nr:hypothetical protein [Flavobacterium fluvii]SHF77501.1 hypothetical protein SAMN05443549_101303 [Flavobacterium fluvii]